MDRNFPHPATLFYNICSCAKTIPSEPQSRFHLYISIAFLWLLYPPPICPVSHWIVSPSYDELFVFSVLSFFCSSSLVHYLEPRVPPFLLISSFLDLICSGKTFSCRIIDTASNTYASLKCGMTIKFFLYVQTTQWWYKEAEENCNTSKCSKKKKGLSGKR